MTVSSDCCMSRFLFESSTVISRVSAAKMKTFHAHASRSVRTRGLAHLHRYPLRVAAFRRARAPFDADVVAAHFGAVRLQRNRAGRTGGLAARDVKCAQMQAAF